MSHWQNVPKMPAERRLSPEMLHRPMQWQIAAASAADAEDNGAGKDASD